MKRIALIAGMMAATIFHTPASLAADTIEVPSSNAVTSAAANRTDETQASWDYSIDAVGDSNDGAIYDIRAIAIQETADTVYVAISANFPIAGVDNPRAEDGEIGWGDMFFNFSGSSFSEAHANGELFAVKFAQATASGVAQTGVYGNVSARSVGATNDGFTTLEEYYDAGLDRLYTLGSDLVTKADAYRYYAGLPTGPDAITGADTTIHNVIDDATRLGDIELVGDQDAIAAGIDFAAQGAAGDVLITFKFDRELLPAGDFVASVFIECANDGVAIVGELSLDAPVDSPEPDELDRNTSAVTDYAQATKPSELVTVIENSEAHAETAQEVPEPGALAGMAVVGVGLLGRSKRLDNNNLA